MKTGVILAVMLCLGLTVVAARSADLPAPDKGKLLSGAEMKALILGDFIRYDPDYIEHRKRLGDRLDQMMARLSALQAAGHEMECSNQIYLEAKWLHRYTAYWDRLEKKLDELEKSLDQPDQDFAAEQSPKTGLWGACYEESFFKMEATMLALTVLESRDEVPHFAVHLPHPFADPQEGLDHLRALLVSDIAHNGVDNRGELGNLGTVASIVYFKSYLQDYLNNRVLGLPRNQSGPGRRTAEYATMFGRFIDDWQDPASGYWGPWYQSEGRYYKSADLSFTFHIISYKRGYVGHWPEIINTTMAIKDEPYPFGWSHNGEFVNHNNYDVAKIFRYGWSHMSAPRQREVAGEIGEMLQWTLNHSLQTDGSFKTVPSFFSSQGADFYFGVSFLQTIGYWDSGLRFWTSEDFPEATSVCERIKTRLEALGFKGQESLSALARLEEACD